MGSFMTSLIGVTIDPVGYIIPRPGSLPLFDPAVLEGYAADDLVVRLVEMFSEDAPRRAREIVDGADVGLRARAAHALRGCALNLGATDLARAAGAIETAMRAGDGARVNELAQALEALTASTVQALRDYCSGMQRAPL